MIPQNPHKNYVVPTWAYNNGQQSGWREGFEDLKSWLFSPCTEHPYKEYHGKLRLDWSKKYHNRRYRCPICMKELEEESRNE